MASSGCHQENIPRFCRQTKESPEEMQVLGLDVVGSGKALGITQQLSKPGFASSFVYQLWD